MNAIDLKNLVLTRLQELGFVVSEDGVIRPPPMDDKNWLRQIYRPAQQLELTAHRNWLRLW